MGWLVLLLLPMGHAVVYSRTQGRSGPVAALTFVLFGPVLGVGLLIAAITWEAAKADSLNRPPETSETVFGLELYEYAALMVGIGLVVSLMASMIYAESIADELRGNEYFGPLDRPRPVAVPALHGLGLTPRATLEDVERAYRELAKTTHPDGGGDVASFKRLQRNYEIAKRYVSLRMPTTPQPSDA